MLTVTEELAGWSASVTPGDLPHDVRHTVARHLLDGVGVALAAARTGAAGAAIRVARGLGGPPEAAVLGDALRIGAAAAAFGTGVLVHALDFDDTHAEGLVHATAAVLPTALAVGQQVGATGTDVLAAAAVGYEVVCRLAAGAPHGFHARGLHATGVCAPLAAAAVAARLLHLDRAAFADALGIAGSSSAGLLEFLETGSSTKQVHPGSAALSGIIAARLAADGATGPRTVVEGKHGVYAALSARAATPARVVRDLPMVALPGSPGVWEAQAISVKPYPCCQLMHGALDAGLRLLSGGVDAGSISAVRVHLHPDSLAVVGTQEVGKTTPRTPYEAKFALPWSLAALLLDGQVTVGTYAEASLRRTDIAGLARRVQCLPATGPGPAARATVRVVIELADGTCLHAEVHGSRGGPDDPLQDDELLGKFQANAGGAGSVSGELAYRMMALSDEQSLDRISALAAALVPGSPA